jgi:hypothetical protein
MREQLQHLYGIATRQPSVALHIVPFSAGIYRGMRTPYSILEFPDPDQPSVLLLEYPQHDEIIIGGYQSRGPYDHEQRQDNPEMYIEIFWELEQTYTSSGSLQMLADAVKQLE